MAHNVQKVLEVTGAGVYYVETNNTATRNYLDALAPTFQSDTATEQWAAKLATGKYVVSYEAYKRVQARRFS